MQIVDIVKTVATTIDILIAIICFGISVSMAKDKKNNSTVMLLLVLSGMFIANAVVMWV